MSDGNPAPANPISQDVRYLGGLLGKIIVEQHGEEALALVEAIRADAKDRRSGDHAAALRLSERINALDLPSKHLLIKAFGNYFQLINIAEDIQRVRVLREREEKRELSESLYKAVEYLHQCGMSGEQMLHLLRRISVRLVLTAHPSEAKRKHVLLKLRDIAEMMNMRDRQHLLPREAQIVEQIICGKIEELWQTRPNRLTQTTVADEVNFGLYFLTNVIMDTVCEVYNDLRHILREYYPEINWTHLPLVLRYASWVGGDRDGNPNVTADVTLETLKTLREAVRQVYIQAVDELYMQLTQFVDEAGVSEELLAALPADDALNTVYPGEYYRQFCCVIRERLAADAYRDGEALHHDLMLIDNSLRTHNGVYIAEGKLRRLLQKVRLFGLHLVPLDIREDARLHTEALTELFRAYRICENYAALPEAEKQALLTSEINNPRPFFPPELDDFSEVTGRVVRTWRMIATAHRQYGTAVIDSVIASHSEAPSDVLAMLMLAKEVGVQNDVDIVPLFETIQDLENAPRVMQTLFQNPSYRAHLAVRKMRQQIMLGYSDSGKDGGYLCSNWSLYIAQRDLADLCAQHEVSLELFHGRGGSIGRGGGPTNQAILAQPPASMQSGRLKITEQGEVIAYRYSNHEIARRHLHQVLHAALIAVGAPSDTPIKDRWIAAMDTLSASSKAEFQALVYGTPGFMDYWQQATPINELAQLPISSRPPKRKTSGSFEDVRAIPWVFSWMQSRAIIPSWYGVGTALTDFCQQNPDGMAILKEMYGQWAFFRTLVENVQLDLAKADMEIAELYASLVSDEKLRESIFCRIRDEHARACAMINAILDQPEILSNSPVIKRSIERRNPYVDPLNFIQVATLRELRQLDPSSPDYDATLQAVLNTVNAIAAGMKTTG